MGRVVDAVKQLPDADNTVHHLRRGRQRVERRGRAGGLAEREPVLQRLSGEGWQDNLKAIDELEAGPSTSTTSPRPGRTR